MMEPAVNVNLVITTALIPGRKTPVLVNQETLAVTKAGSVCVNLAAANGGNVAQTSSDELLAFCAGCSQT
jgi:NAD/NADP transhydrogenase alpha subunit